MAADGTCSCQEHCRCLAYKIHDDHVGRGVKGKDVSCRDRQKVSRFIGAMVRKRRTRVTPRPKVAQSINIEWLRCDLMLRRLYYGKTTPALHPLVKPHIRFHVYCSPSKIQRSSVHLASGDDHPRTKGNDPSRVDDTECERLTWHRSLNCCFLPWGPSRVTCSGGLV